MSYQTIVGVGSFLNVNPNIPITISDAIQQGMYAVQLCLGPDLTPNDPTAVITTVQKLQARFPIHIFTHFTCASNLAGSTKQLAWQGNGRTDSWTRRQLRQLERELDLMAQFGTSTHPGGVVIHPGSYPDRVAGCQAIAQSINQIKFAPHSMLLLENAAGQGNNLGTTLAELHSIWDAVDEPQREHVKFCLDTAHLFGYGEYDLRESDNINRLWDDFDRLIGLEHLRLIHLNDSVVPFSSRKDRHEMIGRGQIWSKSLESLGLLLSKCQELKIPVILETTPVDVQVLARLNEENEFGLNVQLE